MLVTPLVARPPRWQALETDRGALTTVGALVAMPLLHDPVDTRDRRLRGAPTLLGQLSFVTGSDIQTARRYGLLVGDEARFSLPGGGPIVLRLAGGNHLVAHGRLELTRALRRR